VDSKKAVILVSIAAGIVSSPLKMAKANPFQGDKLKSGYANLSEQKKNASGKCGPNKLNKSEEKKVPGKCGVGKCGESKKDKQLQIKEDDKKIDGKCGTGKCGATKQ
jgi:uncharacterized low-complexity protein